jgi:hypothetical protein
MLRYFAPVALATSLAAGCAGQDPPAASPEHGPAIDPAAASSQGMNVRRSYKTTPVAPCQVAPIDVATTGSIDWRFVGPWPGDAIIAHPPAVGTEVRVLEEPLKKLVDLRLHGEPAATTIAVRFRGVRREAATDALVFDVAVTGTQSDAAMCHRWTSEAHAAGELVLGASDGALVSLRLRGPMSDAEALCPEGAKESGVSAEPKTCNHGEMRIEVGSRGVAVPGG